MSHLNVCSIAVIFILNHNISGSFKIEIKLAVRAFNL